MSEMTDFDAGGLVQEVKHLNKHMEHLSETLKTIDSNWNSEHTNLRDEVFEIKQEIFKLKGFFAGAVFISTIMAGLAGYMM